MVLAVATSTQTAMGVTAHLTRRRDYRVSELVEDIRALHRTRTAHGSRRGADPRQRPRTVARRKVARWRITHRKCLGRALPVALAHGDDGWLGGLGRSRPVSRDHRRGGAHTLDAKSQLSLSIRAMFTPSTTPKLRGCGNFVQTCHVGRGPAAVQPARGQHLLFEHSRDVPSTRLAVEALPTTSTFGAPDAPT
jgi:hypothetical protein